MTEEMETLKESLIKIGHPEAFDKFQTNCANLPCTISPSFPANTSAKMILYSFSWRITPEGEQYWGDIYDKLFE